MPVAGQDPVVQKSESDWAPPDGEIGSYVHLQSETCLQTYSYNPTLIDEHANIELSTAQGGLRTPSDLRTCSERRGRSPGSRRRSDHRRFNQRRDVLRQRRRPHPVGWGQSSSPFKPLRETWTADRPFRARVQYTPTKQGLADAGELARRKDVPIVWAVPFGRAGVGRFWAFFPTEYETTLSGILNAPWKTNEDRQNLLTGDFNDELLEAAAALVVEHLADLSDEEDPARHLDLMPARGREPGCRLATGTSHPLYARSGAGEGIRTLDPLLGKHAGCRSRRHNSDARLQGNYREIAGQGASAPPLKPRV